MDIDLYIFGYTIISMPKVLISVTEKELERIDWYSKKERYTRSQLMAKGTLDFIERQLTGETHTSMETDEKEQKKPLGRCEYQYCKNPAIGRFRYKFFDNQWGDTTEKKQSLCETHKNMAKTEMEKHEGEFHQIN